MYSKIPNPEEPHTHKQGETSKIRSINHNESIKAAPFCAMFFELGVGDQAALNAKLNQKGIWKL
jgi:hypothetical protein